MEHRPLHATSPPEQRPCQRRAEPSSHKGARHHDSAGVSAGGVATVRVVLAREATPCRSRAGPVHLYEEIAMQLYQLIDRLLQCERRMRQIYLRLSERTDCPSAMRAFWHDMAEAEDAHRAFLERTAGRLHFMTAPPETPETTLAHGEAKLVAAETAVQQPHLSADDALRLALCLEDGELHALEEAWCRGFHPSLESLLHVTFPEEEAHIRRLVDAVHLWSTDAELRRQAAALWATYQQQQSACRTATP